MVVTACSMALRWLPTAASRSGGVLGICVGHAALMMLAPLVAAVCRASSLARCASFGCTVRSICSVGHAITAAPQPLCGVGGVGGFAACGFGVFEACGFCGGVTSLNRAFCSS